MYMQEINYPAVLACGVVSLMIGAIWYGYIFNKTWVKLVNKSEEELKQMEKDAPKTYICAFIGALVQGYVLAYIAAGMKVHNVTGALMMGFFIWLGIAAVMRFNNVLFEKRPIKLFAVNSGFELAMLLAMSLIVSLWK